MEDFDYTDLDLLSTQDQINKILSYFCQKAINQRKIKNMERQKKIEEENKKETEKIFLIDKAKGLGYKADGSRNDFIKLGVGEDELEKIDKYVDPVGRFLYLFGLYVG